ncbi:MAG: pyrroline-5-carboxylate reductase [Boseongicola sp.]|nr:MAG: pyrroline-5-carboxylate reductase [Boseongicola sp.]
MNFEDISTRGLVLLGCGKMGSAMLEGWLKGGLVPDAVHVLDPYPSEWLNAQGVRVNDGLPARPAVVIVAVKPQMMGEALPSIQAFGNGDTIFVSIAAGTTISTFEDAMGVQTPIVRAMPNTPAAIGRGITALIGNSQADEAAIELAEKLLAAVGKTVRLSAEAEMDAVTAVSGSGPAYVFHLIETMAAAGVAQGLPKELAMKLALTTVSGAGALAEASDDSPTQLRINVTSPNGTTQAALEVLMDPSTGFPDVVSRGIAAAAERSKELG